MRTLLSVRTIVAMALVSLGLAACGSSSSGSGTGTGTGTGSGTGTGTGTGGTSTGSGTGAGGSVTSLLFNEILANPPNCKFVDFAQYPECETNPLWGDANGDGMVGSKEDEFIEIVNASNTSYDLSGVKILRSIDGFPDPGDSTSIVFTFASGETLAAGQAAVVFSGVSDDDDSSGAITTTFNGVTVQSYLAGSFTSSPLQLNDTTYLVLATASGQLLDKVAFTDEPASHPDALPLNANNSRMSIVRVPDITGTDWALIGDVANHYADGPFTPGVRTDGSAF